MNKKWGQWKTRKDSTALKLCPINYRSEISTVWNPRNSGAYCNILKNYSSYTVKLTIVYTLKQQFKVTMPSRIKKQCILWNTWIRISNDGNFGLIWVPYHAVVVILTGPEFLFKLTLNMLWLSPRLFFTIFFLRLQILPIQPGYSGVTHVGFWTHCSLVGLYLVCDWLSRTTRLLFSSSSPISW